MVEVVEVVEVVGMGEVGEGIETCGAVLSWPLSSEPQPARAASRAAAAMAARSSSNRVKVTSRDFYLVPKQRACPVYVVSKPGMALAVQTPREERSAYGSGRADRAPAQLARPAGGARGHHRRLGECRGRASGRLRLA